MILIVDLEFDEHADFEDTAIKEITEKVALSIKKTAEEVGLTPDGYETSLAHVRVAENYSNISTTESI